MTHKKSIYFTDYIFEVSFNSSVDSFQVSLNRK